MLLRPLPINNSFNHQVPYYAPHRNFIAPLHPVSIPGFGYIERDKKLFKKTKPG
jgi:hypothetical protein